VDGYRIIESWTRKGSRVLVLACGEGEIIKRLEAVKKDTVLQGIDIDEKKVAKAISSGLSVVQGDINKDIFDYQDKSFDLVIADDILQLTDYPDRVLLQLLKIGKKVMVSFPNFAYLKIRLTILLLGRMPKTDILPYDWYDTPNIHLFTVRDFKDFCIKNTIKILMSRFIGAKGFNTRISPNLTAKFAYFLLKGSG